MANDWTRLLQETSKHGGPDALRAFYQNRGKLEGAGAMLLLAAGLSLVVKARRSFAKAKNVDSAEPATAPARADNATPSADESAEPQSGTDSTGKEGPVRP
jgi:hypothetical protein